MPRESEYRTNGGVFTDPMAAIESLDANLEKIKRSNNQHLIELRREKKFRLYIAGVKSIFVVAISDGFKEWSQLGLDASIVQYIEHMDYGKYSVLLSFRHPVYEYIWLTDLRGNNVSDDFRPFLNLSVVFFRDRNLLGLNVSRLETRVHIPDRRTTFNTVRKDIEMIKNETGLLDNVLRVAEDTQKKILSALIAFCRSNDLIIETPKIG